MFSFFTQLEIYSLLLIQAIGLAVISFAKKISGKKDSSKKIYDLLEHFQSLLVYSGQKISRDTDLLLKYARAF